MFEKDLIVREIRALGEALQRLVLGRRSAIVAMEERAADDVDAWLERLDLAGLDTIDLDRLLSGIPRGETPETLTALIAAVNAGAADLNGEARTKRYRLKARLQSELWRRARARVVLEVETDAPHLARLHLRGRPAQHARITDLDADVQAALRATSDAPN